MQTKNAIPSRLGLPKVGPVKMLILAHQMFVKNVSRKKCD